MGKIGQGHSVTLDQGLSGSIFQKIFSETTEPMEVKFDMEPL